MIFEDKESGKAVIAAYNFFSGTVNFIVLGIPKGWRVAVNEIPPDIIKYRVIDKYAWVIHGFVIHAIYKDNEQFLVLEVDIYSKKPKKTRYKLVSESKSGSVYIYGHRAEYVLGEFEKGFIRKSKVKGLKISFQCDITNRWIELYFLGEKIFDVYKDILFSVTKSVCH